MKKYYPLLTVILLGLPLCSQALTLNLRGDTEAPVTLMKR